MLPIAHQLQERGHPDQGVIAARHMGTGAAPGIIPGLRREAGPDGILLDIAPCRKPVRLAQWTGGEASLPEMAAPPSRKFTRRVYRLWASPMTRRRPSSESGTAIKWTWLGIRQYAQTSTADPRDHSRINAMHSL